MSAGTRVHSPCAPDKSTARARNAAARPVIDRLTSDVAASEKTFFSAVQLPPGVGARSIVSTPFVNEFVTNRSPCGVRPVIRKPLTGLEAVQTQLNKSHTNGFVTVIDDG